MFQSHAMLVVGSASDGVGVAQNFPQQHVLNSGGVIGDGQDVLVAVPVDSNVDLYGLLRETSS